LQKAGHASWTQAGDGEWYLVYLMGRPIEGDKNYENKYGQFAQGESLNRGYCPLGRETSIARLEWRDGWPYVVGGNQPAQTVECALEERPWEADFPETDHFDGDALNIHFQSLRIPLGENLMSLSARPGHLRLYGAHSLTSTFEQAHVARRWQSLNFDAGTSVEFAPKNLQQMAGLANYYNTENWTALYVTFHEEKGRVLDVMTADNGVFENPIYGSEIPVPESARRVHLKVQARGDVYAYSYSFDGSAWSEIPLKFSSHKLSDDYVRGPAFTGAFVGMFCADCSGTSLHADFDYFSYKEI